MKRLFILLITSVGLAIYSYLRQAPNHPVSSWRHDGYSGPLQGMRSSLMAALRGVTSDSEGLVAGLAIGDTSRLSQQTLDTMKVVSLTHLTAVSGANCAIVTGLVFILVSRMGISRWIRIVIAVATLVLYILLVGPQPSVLRAGVMALVVLLASGLGRASAPNQALALCIIALLISNPWLAVDYGFQLSALATLGIIELSPRLASRFATSMPRPIAVALSVSIAAQLLCLPVLLQLQPGLSTYSIPANIMAEPLVAPITVLGMLACLIAPVAPAIAGFLTWLGSLGAWLIIQIAAWLAEAPAATLGWPGGLAGVLAAVLVVGAFALWLRSGTKGVRKAAGLAVALTVSITFGGCSAQRVRDANWPPPDWSVVSCDVGQGDATVIRSQGEIAVIDVGRKPVPINRCLKRLGIRQIDLLVLTHFDLDHVGGLSGALAGRSVMNALVTSYNDVRPAAKLSNDDLKKSVKQVTEAETGMSGRLGALGWKVLSPHRGAPEAEDSNDGSVTMLFSGSAFVFLGLADLGARGQMRLVAESAQWLGRGFGHMPVVVKVSHHGSSDQYPELYAALRPRIALFSVGMGNDYGHPTRKTLGLLERTGASIYRTDQQGNLAVSIAPEGLRVRASGRD